MPSRNNTGSRKIFDFAPFGGGSGSIIPPPPSGSYIQTEAGDNLALENGDLLVTE